MIDKRLSCSFMSYRDPYDTNLYDVKQHLSDVICELISFNDVRIFYFTGDNMIDRMAYEIVSHIKKLKYYDIQRVYVHTKPWNDTFSVYSKEFIQNGFEKIINAKQYISTEKTGDLAKYKHLIDLSCFVIYYVKLNSQMSFLNFKKILLKNKSYSYLMKTLPKSTINLIDFDVNHYFQVKDCLDLIKLDLNKVKKFEPEEVCTNILIAKDNFYLSCCDKTRNYKHITRAARKVRNCSYSYKKRKKPANAKNI